MIWKGVEPKVLGPANIFFKGEANKKKKLDNVPKGKKSKVSQFQCENFGNLSGGDQILAIRSEVENV